MEPRDYYMIERGDSVDIQRSDGRVHPASIYQIHWDKKTVSVEWQELGETKGKEIDFNAIVALNPDVVKYDAQKFSNRIHVPDTDAENVPCKKRISQTPAPNNEKPYVPIYTKQITMNPLTRNTTRSSIASHIKKSASTATVKPIRHTQLFEKNGLNDQDRRENVPPTLPAPTPTRKSNVVKEVEKLKKQREERRLRQDEEKAKKEAFLQKAPGNPYWEFLNMVQEYQSTIEFRPLKETDPIEDHQITVCVRKRPLNKREMTKKEVDVIAVPAKNTVIVHEPKNKVDLTKYLENQMFRFDYVFNENCTNELVYRFTAQPLVRTVFEGGMATCFAYGQTGSGKTHTMGGDFNGKTQDCQKGIYALVAKDVFEYLKLPRYRAMNFVVSASFFEIYSGKVFDLLCNKTKLRILEDAKQQVQVVGLTEIVVQNREDVLKLIQQGNAARTSGQTSANSNSSRSHAIFQIVLRTLGLSKIHGKFSLIDLAGNERGADTSSADRQIRMEGAEINKSLLALKECIRALGRRGAHLPFRASKLTQVLRDSFIGEKSRTCMIAMISPGVASCEHTLNTLRYADRVKELVAAGPETRLQDEDNSKALQNSKSDLQQLQSLSKNDLSDELFNFHQALTMLQANEEETIDNHKLVNDFLKDALEKASYLYAVANNVEYDQDAYCQRWEELLTNGINLFAEARDKVIQFRKQLLTEEQLSRKMKP